MHKWVKGAFGSQRSLFVLLFWFQRCEQIFAEADRRRAQPDPSNARTACACWQHTRRAEAGLGAGLAQGTPPQWGSAPGASVATRLWGQQPCSDGSVPV